MISEIPKWWSFLTYDGLKSHVNVTDALDYFAEERIKVGNEEGGTSNFNQAYDKFQAKQDKAQKGSSWSWQNGRFIDGSTSGSLS